MKFLQSNFRNFSHRSNWAWMSPPLDDGPEGRGEGWENNSLIRDDIKRAELTDQEKKEKILELVKSPLRFSYRDIKFIEANLDLIERDKTFRVRFRKVSEYFLSLSVVDSTIMPPRILYQLNGSKLARRFLPLKIQRGIKLIVDEHINEMRALSEEDPSQWSMGKTSKLIMLYKYLKKRNEKTGNVLDGEFKIISEKLVKKAVSIGQQEKLTSSDQLILWEIRNQLPDNFKFSGDVNNVLNVKSQIDSQDLVDNILSDKTKNNPDLILLWDLLEDLAYQGKVEITDLQKKKIRNFVLRGNSTQLLEAFSKSSPKIFLPIHLEAFKTLKEDDFKNLWNDTNGQFDEEVKIEQTDEDNTNIVRYQKEIAKIKEEMDDLEEKDFSDILAREGAIVKDKRGPYDESVTRLQEYVDAAYADQGAEPKTIAEFVIDLKRLFGGDSKKPFNSKLDPLFARFESETKNKKKFKILSEIIQIVRDINTKGIEEAIKNENRGNTEVKTLNAVNKIKEVVEQHTGITPTDDNSPDQNNTENTIIPEWASEDVTRVSQILHAFDDGEILENFKTRVERVDTAKTDIKKILNQPHNNKIKLLDKKLTEIQNKYNEESISNAEIHSIFEIYANPESGRADIEKQYYTDLQNRIENHTLHTADFQVIMSEESGNDQDKQQIHEFREAFEGILNGIDIDVSQIDVSQIDHDNPNSEVNLDLIRPWLDKLESQIGIDVFRNALKEELESFDSPQIKDEILKGALGYFNKTIEEKISNAFDGFADNTTQFRHQKDIFLNHVRTHNAIHTPQEIKQIDGAYKEYFVHKTDGDLKVEVERNKLEGAIEGLPAEEQEKIRAAYEYGVNMLNQGYSTDEFDFPGKTKIQEAALQTAPLKQEFIHFNSGFKDSVDEMVGTLTNKERDKDDFDLSFNKFIKSWDVQGASALSSKIESFKTLCENNIFSEKDESGNLVYKKFLKEYFKTIDLAYVKITESIAELKRVKDSSLTGKEQVFPRIKSGFDDLLGLIDFSGGDFAKYRIYLENRLFEHKVKDKNGKNTDIDENGFSETVQNLKDYGIFDDKEKANDTFRKNRANFNIYLRNYESNIKKVNNRISGDLKNLSDENFQEKYGMYKAEAQNIVERNSEQMGDFNNHWKRFNDKDYFDGWLEKYNENSKSRFEAIKEFQDFERLGQTLSKMDTDAAGVEKWLSSWDEYGQTAKSNRWYNRVEMQSFSLYSIYHMIKKNMEIVETRWKRKQDQMAYNIGMKIYGDSAWGMEFRRMGEESEEARVKEWETTYDELDVWDLAEQLYKTKDMDEAKACINLLNQKGYLKWDNPRLWRTLMRLQSSVTFNIPEDMSLEVADISKKVGQACEIIWSKEVFRNWDTTIDENIDKTRGSHEKEFRDLTDSQIEGVSMLSKSLATMLEKWQKGDTKDVYPDKFTAFLHLAFEQGKLNGQPDKRWYYLIKGVTTKNPQGEPLISKTTFMKFNGSLLASMPYFDFFSDKSAWKKNGRIVPPNTPGAHQGIWQYEDFIGWGNMMGDNNGTFLPDTSTGLQTDIEKFFYEVIDMSDIARDRVKRMGRSAKDKADHDDGETFFTGLEEKEVLQLLSSMSQGTQQVTDDFWRAFLAGFDRYMRNRQETIANWDKEYGLENQNWQAMRKKMLKDVGTKLRTAVTVTQVLSASIETDQTSPLIWSEDDWEKEGGMVLRKGQQSKDEINSMIFDILDQSGGKKSEEYKKELSAEYYKKSKHFKKIKVDPAWKVHNRKVNELLSDEGGSQYFGDTDKVWKALKNYKSGGLGGMA